MVRRNGLTLIELLTVVVIIVICVGLALPALLSARKSSMRKRAKAEIDVLKSALDQYESAFGVYPPSSLLKDSDNDPNDINLGNESMMAGLSTGLEGGPFLKQYGKHGADNHRNSDGDSASANLTGWVWEDNGLREFVDPWDNPYIYFSAADYESGVIMYKIKGRDTSCEPRKVAGTTDEYYEFAGYQLWSCGPNQTNDTNSAEFLTGEDDDVRSWEAKR